MTAQTHLASPLAHAATTSLALEAALAGVDDEGCEVLLAALLAPVARRPRPAATSCTMSRPKRRRWDLGSGVLRRRGVAISEM